MCSTWTFRGTKRKTSSTTKNPGKEQEKLLGGEILSRKVGIKEREEKKPGFLCLEEMGGTQRNQRVFRHVRVVVSNDRGERSV